nr:kinase D-interacting substrate of 220 kDa-like [Leptinotarsa decemlineata]
MSLRSSTSGSGSSRNFESSQLLLARPKSYGSLLPYYEFIRATVRAQQGQTLHRTDSMVSLCYRSLTGFINDDNLQGLQSFLENKQVQVDDKDENGTTALMVAASKGRSAMVRELLIHGADPNAEDNDCWTALLCASKEGHIDIVLQLLEHNATIDHRDIGGWTSLMWATYKGRVDVALLMIERGADVNAQGIRLQDRSGDTNLIHAIKGGHRGTVEALLKKYADVDILGKDRKTATYVAVEKGNAGIVKLLLTCNPDLELATKDGDTAILKAVRSRNAEIVQLLLDKKAKVSAADKKGDTALHIAMRARSKAIVEILLRNPKNSQLLYRPNRAGETPYNIDMTHQKTILGQIFGARRLNTNEDNENMLGYDLYSSALADILSEPSLSMPITVGLYAKWGSGKSFLLNKLREEMKNFAREWVDPVFQFTIMLFIILVHIALVIGTIIGLSLRSWIVAACVVVAFVLLGYLFIALIWYASRRYDWDWAYNFNLTLTKKMDNLKLVLQILFCHPPGASHDGLAVQPIRFFFTDQTRVSSTAGGENSVVQMIGSLYDAIENRYGSLATRLYRAFKPKPVKTSSTWTWRKVCCLPYVIFFEIIFLMIIIGTCALTIYLIHANSQKIDVQETYVGVTLKIILIVIALLLGVATIANMYTWSKLLRAVFFSQRRHLQRSISKLETLKSEGFLQTLREEVNLMKEMVKCLDSLCSQQTRLVIVVDGLDSCEQDKVLLVLDTVHMLFSDANTPFIVILAIDPHVIAKAVEINTRRLFSESNIGGHNYLSNMVHLPFYLQNSGLRKVKIAQQTAAAHRKQTGAWTENEENLNSFLARSSSSRRLSNEKALMSSQENLGKFPGRKGSRKLKLSESVASSIGSNLNRIGGAQDLTKMLLTDDYFSDVNPRSMRRLMNVVYITGRLLKAFQIDFNWYRLASWINITEQWPFRTSWILYHYDMYEDSLDDNVSLKSIYDKIRPHIPMMKDTEPLLELDRDEKKFDIFLSFHRSSLLVSDLKIFLPFTINLDPYLKKIIKEETQGLEEDEGVMMGGPSRNSQAAGNSVTWNTPRPALMGRMRATPKSVPVGQPQQAVVYPQMSGMPGWQPWTDQMSFQSPFALAPVTVLEPEILETRLSTLNVDGVCKLLSNMEDLNPQALAEYTKMIREQNINGRVLLHCDLEELKKLLKMSFGDWEMFKVLLITLREHEITSILQQDEVKPVRAAKQVEKRIPFPDSVSKGSGTIEKDMGKMQVDGVQRKHSNIEKQVTLEEQMICGALQTLNEEACEDVLEETEETKITIEPDVPQTSVIPPSPDASQGESHNALTQSLASNFHFTEKSNKRVKYVDTIVQVEYHKPVVQFPKPSSSGLDDKDFLRGYRSRTNSSSGIGETDFVLLQSSPIGHMHWQPVSIGVAGNSESLSDQSSRCSSQPPSPIVERKLSVGSKHSNLKSGESSSKGRHVVIKTDYSDTHPRISISTTSSSVAYENQLSNKTPLLSEYRHTASQTRTRPSSLNLVKSDSKPLKSSLRNRSKSIDNSQKLEKKEKKGFEKLHKLKEKLLHSSPDLNETSDNESTPLVSEMSTPSKSGQSSEIKTPSSKSLPLSPASQKSLSPDKHTTKFTRSELNLTDTTEVSPTMLLSDSVFIEDNNGTEHQGERQRTMSDDISNSILGYASSIGRSNSNFSLHSCSQSSGRLSRQNALDSEENLTDVYCDPSGKQE